MGVRCSEDFSLLLKNGDGLETKALLPKFVYAPVREGEIAGSIEVSVNGEVVKTIPLVYSESVEQDEKIKLDFWGRIKRWWILGNLQVIKY